MTPFFVIYNYYNRFKKELTVVSTCVNRAVVCSCLLDNCELPKSALITTLYNKSIYNINTYITVEHILYDMSALINTLYNKSIITLTHTLLSNIFSMT